MKNKMSWLDKLGRPQYGGEMVVRVSRNIVNFDPYFGVEPVHIVTAWMERLVADDWTLDPAIFDYKPLWHPSQYVKGQLAKNWEFTAPNTFVTHLRKGITWQDILPANRREIVANNAVFHFNRLFGSVLFTLLLPPVIRAQVHEDKGCRGIETICRKWAIQDSNLRPQSYQDCALTS